MIGKMVGNFEITGQLGKGGMGEVYRAKDRKLGRDVAIKVLPEEFARDADRVARFQREAKLLASLNHPNIAAIYGLEESGGTNFLVLELVEGETLADQIKRGPIPVEESLKLALQIAEALEAAHEKGVIHRDLKPANIKVTPDGKVKVLDFGLAKVFADDQSNLNLSNSPTLSDAATMQGTILGTAAYMPPEQAKGKPVDKRADVWSFGVVLFEMLAGRQLFSGETVSETLASVIKSEPAWKDLPQKLHPRTRLLLERCLEKDPRDRYGSINDARVDVQKVLADPGGVFVQPLAAAEPRKKLQTILAWVAALVLITIIAGVTVCKLKPPEPRQVIRFDYELPEGQQFSGLGWGDLAVSPDGRQFVYSTPQGLYMRSVNESTAKLIAGTEGSTQSPFYSPDGKWIGYCSVADRQLKKIAVDGGAPETLCGVTQLMGAWWSADNTIVYGQMSGNAIMRVSADGGTPEPLIRSGSDILRFPQVLPDGRSVLYTAYSSPDKVRIMVESPKSGGAKELFAGSEARYLPTGHIVYRLPNNDNIFAIEFDPGSLEVKGGGVSIVGGAGQAAFSNAGTLVYMRTQDAAVYGRAAARARTLVWVDRKGTEEPIAAEPKSYRYPHISPDGTRVAMTVVEQGASPVYIWDLNHKTLRRLTFEGRYHESPVWTPDGQRIAFWSFGTEEHLGVYWKAANGTGKDELLVSGLKWGGVFFPYCWTRDGKTLVGAETQDLRRFDIAMLSMEGDRTRTPLLQESYLETQPKISPNGRWMAYTSDESGKSDVHVRSFPDVNKGHWQVSTGGGVGPLWSPNGRELFYQNGDAVMAVTVVTEPIFNIVGTPQALFRRTYVSSNPNEPNPWDINPDGKRFLMMKEAGAASSPGGRRLRVNIVLNWFEELKNQVQGK